MKKSKDSKEMVVVYSHSIDGAHVKLGLSEIDTDTKAMLHPIIIALQTGHKRLMYFKSAST